MFQLIVAVIAIALVIALTLASIYYGGEAFTRSSLKANVAAMVNQAQQISGAHTLYKVDNAQDAAVIGDLEGEYISSIPTPPEAIANGSAWTLNAVDDTVDVALTGDAAGNTEVCAEVAKSAGSCNVAEDTYSFPL